MDEYALYKHIQDAYLQLNKPFYCPLTKDFIINLIGGVGLDVLLKTKLIEPTAYPSQYVLCCEPKGDY